MKVIGMFEAGDLRLPVTYDDTSIWYAPVESFDIAFETPNISDLVRTDDGEPEMAVKFDGHWAYTVWDKTRSENGVQKFSGTNGGMLVFERLCMQTQCPSTMRLRCLYVGKANCVYTITDSPPKPPSVKKYKAERECTIEYNAKTMSTTTHESKPYPCSWHVESVHPVLHVPKPEPEPVTIRTATNFIRLAKGHKQPVRVSVGANGLPEFR